MSHHEEWTREDHGNSAYVTRAEAAEHLRVSVDAVDRLLVPMAGRPVPGRMRFRRLEVVRAGRGSGYGLVRIVRADVEALLPLPEVEEVREPARGAWGEAHEQDGHAPVMRDSRAEQFAGTMVKVPFTLLGGGGSR